MICRNAAADYRDQNMHSLLPKNARCGGSYECPADTFLSDCAVKGICEKRDCLGM